MRQTWLPTENTEDTEVDAKFLCVLCVLCENPLSHYFILLGYCGVAGMRILRPRFQDCCSMGNQAERAARQDWGMEIQEPPRAGWYSRGLSGEVPEHHSQMFPCMSG